jgi:peroxiredoxin
MKTRISFLLLAALFIGLWGAREQFSSSATRAPEVVFKDITGQTVALADLRGEPVLVTFWATTCSICIDEFPDLVGLYREFAQEGFRLMAVAMFYDPPNRVVETARAWRFPFPVILDLKAELANAFGSVSLIPASFLIAPDGSIALRQLGRIDPDKLRVVIREMLRSKNG